MSRIWITGGMGFIGRNLAHLYNEIGNDELHGIGLGDYEREQTESVGYRTWLNAELNFDSLSQLAELSGLPDVIFHLAGGAAVGPSIESPLSEFMRTVPAVAELLEWTRLNNANCRVVGVSSAAVYGADHNDQIQENAVSNPFSPYGYHKAMTENLFQSYRQTFGLDLGIVRLFSVYGAGLKKQLMWDLLSKISSSHTGVVELNGSGEEVRDWMHVSDAARLLSTYANADSLDTPAIINGGTGVGTRIRDIVELVSTAWGGGITVKFNGLSRPGDPASLVAETSLANQVGFNPRVSVRDGISEVVEWYREHHI